MSGEQLGIHNQGNWSPAKNGGGVVSDHPGGGVVGGDDVAYYGGYLIAESMGSSNIPIVTASPKMLKALVAARNFVNCPLSAYKSTALAIINEAIAAATTPIAPVQSPPVAAEPVSDSDKWVIQDRVEPRSGIDQIRWSHFSEGLWVNPVGNWTGELHGYVDKSDGSVLSVRCDAKDLPPSPGKQSPVDPVAEPASETKSLKPPLGIKPAVLWIEARRDDIYAAVDRYREAEYVVPAHLLLQLASIEAFLQDDSGDAQLVIQYPNRIGET